jgi:hypothetical protein
VHHRKQVQKFRVNKLHLYHLQQTTPNQNGKLTNRERIGFFFGSAKSREAVAGGREQLLASMALRSAIMSFLGPMAGAVADGGGSSSPRTGGGACSSP